MAAAEAVWQRDGQRSSSGGVIVFYHIAKTGGTTIRKKMSQIHPNNVHYVFARKGLTTSPLQKLIHTVLTRKQQKNKILFVELHGISPGGIPELHETIVEWRQVANRYHVPLFTFTLLREPAHLAASAYYFFNNACRKNRDDNNQPIIDDKCTTDEDDAESANMLSKSVPNRQCLALSRGLERRASSSSKATAVTARECQTVYELLASDDWDWVGRTEELDSTTLPLLYRLVVGSSSNKDNSSTVSMLPENTSNANVQEYPSLSPHTAASLREQSSMDLALYQAFAPA